MAGSTIQAPRLVQSDIKAELERVFARRHKPLLVALFGSGEKGIVAAGGHMFEVVPTRCELELRSLVPPPAEDLDTGLVFLVDWTDEQLPLDLACRFAGRRMYRVTSETRLASMFGARSVDPALLRTALARVLLSVPYPRTSMQDGHRPSERERTSGAEGVNCSQCSIPGSAWSGTVEGLGKVSGQMLQRQQAYRRFLMARMDLPLEEALTPEVLLGWAVHNESGPGFVEQAKRDGEVGSKLREEVASFVTEEAGSPLAAAVWKAWEHGAGDRCLELCLVFETLASDFGTGSYAEGVLKGALPTIAAGWGEDLLRAAPALADPELLDTVLGTLDEEYARSVLDSAEALIDDGQFRETLRTSIRLPLGWKARKQGLAEGLTAISVAGNPSRANLEVLLEAHEELLRHRLHPERSRGGRGQINQMAVRLAAYLVHRATTPEEKVPGADYQEALDLAEAYAREGGFVDWARQRLRGAGEGDLGEAYGALLNKADELRREDDRRFAAGLVRWIEAGRPSSQVLSIAECSKRVVADFLAKRRERKLLVILLDGMSWANAVELVESMADEEGRWAPTCWRPARVEGRSATGIPPVLAPLPTLTTVSRAAFFAGKLSPAHGNEPTVNDRKRWAQNRALGKLLGESDEVGLFLKDDLTARDGERSKVLDAVSSEAKLVAVVLNAIDDQLQGSDQLRVECTAEHIKPLGEILAAAVSAERAVLLVSDHGHVPGDALRSRGRPDDGGARWRALGSSEEPAEFEIALRGKKHWKPKGSSGVAMIWDETVCYGTPRYGEHGGASLAEVVAPMLLLAPETLADPRFREKDEALRTVPLDEPSWWQLRMPEEAVQRPKRRKAPEPKKEVQLSLLEPEPEVQPEAQEPEPKPVPPIVVNLRRSRVFKEHTKGLSADKVESSLEQLGVLVEAGGRLGAEDFARLCSFMAYQVGSYVARMGEVFNVDGYPVIEHDTSGQQVSVNLSMLEQLFEVQR